jgi:lipopolysaccharide transport protein LptA
VKFFTFIMIIMLCGLTVRAQTNMNGVDEILSLVKTNSAPVTEAAHPLTRIDSDSVDFDMNTNARTATYIGHVRVDDPQMKLTCAWLIADLPESGGHMNHIVAETNVVIDATDEKKQPIHATGEKMVYNFRVQNSVTNETVTLTGNPQMENVQGTLTGDVIIWDRANGHISATNQKMIFRQNLNGAMAATNSPPVNTLH